MNLPDSAKLELELTAATSTLESRKMSVGGELTYNGIIPVLETVKAENGELTVSKTPVPPYGQDKAYGFVDKSGNAYEIDAETRKVKGIDTTDGETHCVRYFVQAASAHQLRIDSVFEPGIEICMIRMPLYSTQGDGSTRGTRWGDRYIWIPRMQFAGEMPVKGDQTDADTDTLSGSAIPYEEAAAEGMCIDEASFALAYMVDMPISGPLSYVEGLIMVGGGFMTMKVGETAKVPVKFVMKDGTLVQPDYSILQYNLTPFEVIDAPMAQLRNDGTFNAIGPGIGYLSVRLNTSDTQYFFTLLIVEVTNN